ncbi:hypothetical protein AAHC03_021006 [Spirometra sp. Aus1]
MFKPRINRYLRLEQMLRVLFSTILVALVNKAFSDQPGAWSYTNQQSSSEYWATTANKVCAGTRQSPVPLAYDTAVYVEGLASVFAYEIAQFNESERLIVTNNGRTLLLVFPSCKWYLSLSGYEDRKYCIQQFHFHWGANENGGSEHSIDGRFYPLEMHVVTFDNILYETFAQAAQSPVGLAVLAILFHLDPSLNTTQTPLYRMGNFLSNERAFHDYQSITTMPIFPLAKIFPMNHEMRSRFFRYDGSLTTPPCTENVAWTVMSETVPVTPEELAVFRSLAFAPTENQDQMMNNFRPLQPINPPIPTVPRSIFRSWNSAKELEASPILLYLTTSVAILLRHVTTSSILEH